MGKKYVYLATHFSTADLGKLQRKRLQWVEAIGTLAPIGIRASWLDSVQSGSDSEMNASEIFDRNATDIEDAAGMIVDLSEPGNCHAGVLIEMGIAAAYGKPIVIYAPKGFNRTIWERKMVQGCATVVHDRTEAAQVLTAMLGRRTF